MRRRTLDILVSLGGLGLAILLLILGIVLTTNANFANDYVREQLAAQNINFPPEEALNDQERERECLLEHAGQQLTTGPQAECYANDFIGLHLENIAGGQTYAELGGPQASLRDQLAAAEAQGDPAAAELQQELAQINAQRDSVFKGETLRGLLLTSYGFSEFGRKAGQAAAVAYVAAGLMFLLAIAGFVHAFMTPGNRAFAEPDRPVEP